MKNLSYLLHLQGYRHLGTVQMNLLPSNFITGNAKTTYTNRVCYGENVLPIKPSSI